MKLFISHMILFTTNLIPTFLTTANIWAVSIWYKKLSYSLYLDPIDSCQQNQKSYTLHGQWENKIYSATANISSFLQGQ